MPPGLVAVSFYTAELLRLLHQCGTVPSERKSNRAIVARSMGGFPMKQFLVPALAAVALAIAPAASAAIVVTTYTGTVTEGEGALGVDLAGLAYTAVFTLDTSINRHTPGPDGESDLVVGPDTEGNTSNPFLSAVVTLDGSPIPLPLFGANYAYVGVGTAIGHSSGIAAPNFWDFFAEHAGIPGSLDTAFSVSPTETSYGEIAMSDGQGGFSLWFRGDVSRVNTVVDGGVPEPATWAMMILGFGAIGAVARRRRYAFA